MSRRNTPTGLIVFALVCLHPAVAKTQDVKMVQVPADLPEPARTELTLRREDLRSTSAKIVAAVQAFNASCGAVLQGNPQYEGCMREKTEIQSGIAKAIELKRAFNLDVEAAARIARMATTLTFTNIRIEGEVHFQNADGEELSQSDLAEMKIPPGTRIVTGPGGTFRADVPGGHSFNVGGGAALTIDSIFMNPNGLQKLAVDLQHGFFRWVKEAGNTLQALRDSSRLRSRFRVRTQTVAVAVRGTDVEFLFDESGAGTIKLREGLVTVDPVNPGDVPLILRPGEMVAVTKDGKISRPRKFIPQQ